jgi:hypothetical protein
MPNLTLYRGWLEPNRYVWSPFVTKLEARLRFANAPYKAASGSVRTAPKGKIPYIEITDEDSSNSIGDSTLIIKHSCRAEHHPGSKWLFVSNAASPRSRSPRSS